MSDLECDTQRTTRNVPDLRAQSIKYVLLQLELYRTGTMDGSMAHNSLKLDFDSFPFPLFLDVRC